MVDELIFFGRTLGRPHVESFNYMLGDGLRLRVAANGHCQQ